MGNPVQDGIADTLARVHDAFEAHGIWHALVYGTLIGAMREGDVIEWDYDFDLLVKPAEVERILQLNGVLAADGIEFRRTYLRGDNLAVNPGGLGRFHTSSLGVWRDGEKWGDLYCFTLFRDGVLRRYDPESGAYWCPHSSFPHWFLAELETATIRGKSYPVPRRSDVFLAGTYGDDWRTPYKAAMQGGEIREGVTVHGDTYAPKLHREIAWCEAQGWDRSVYAAELPWPQRINGAGPVGPTERTEGNSNALWWRSVGELLAHF